MAKAKFYKLDQSLAARRDIRTSDKVALSIITDSVGKNSHSWIGIRSIADLAGVDPKTVNKSVDRLEAAGLLLIERRGNGRSHHYRLPGQSVGDMGTVPDQTVGETPALSGENRGSNGDGAGSETVGETPPTVGEAPTEPWENLPPNQTDEEPDLRKCTAPPRPAATKPPTNGARGRMVVAHWLDGYRACVGQDYPDSGRGKLGGILKGMLGDFDEAALTRAIDRWFVPSRAGYEVGFFKTRLVGGSAELTGRSTDSGDDAYAQELEQRKDVSDG